MKNKVTKKLISGVIYEICSFIALVLPIAILAITRRSTWFIDGKGKSISLGLVVAIIFALVMLKSQLKQKHPQLMTFATLIIMLVLIYLFDSVLDDLFWIVVCAMVGYAMYLVLAAFAHKDLKYYNEYKSESIRVEARSDAEKDKQTDNTGW